ncbi:MAG: hypothetical protein MUO26_04875 [Methanotrichaceae archaeon]|nr:hypothetical protein [Methanotrichaceae archaeon]
MSRIRKLIIIFFIVCFFLIVSQGQIAGPGGAPTSESKGPSVSPAAGGGGGARTVDFDRLFKTLQDAKKNKAVKFEELQKLLYIKPFTTEEYDTELGMALGIEANNNTTLSRNDKVKIFAYVENPNPIEIRRALYLYLEALGPSEKSFRQLNLVPQIIQVNEYSESFDNKNSTVRVFPDINSFDYLKIPGPVVLRLKASDGVYELYSGNKTLNITNIAPNLSGIKIDSPDQPRYNDPIEYVSNVTDLDGDMVNVTLHILDDQKRERANTTQVVKPGDKVGFMANQYGFFKKDDAGKNFTYYYTYGDGIAVNQTDIMIGPNLRKSIALWVEEKPLVVPEDESQYWWQNYNFSLNMKNQDPGTARVSVSLFTDTEAHPWKIVDTKDVEVSQELKPVYFNVKPFDVLDASKNFSFRFKYSEMDQREKDSAEMRWAKPINQKLLKYDIASFPLVLNIFGIMLVAILCGIFIERRFYR